MSFVQPTDDEKAMVAKLKQRFQTEHPNASYQYSDTTVLRFYRGRKNVEENAYKALVKHMEWREANHVDGIEHRTHEFQRELNSGKFIVAGRDNKDRPAVFIFADRHNKNDRDVDELRQVIIYTLEKLIFEMANPQEERMVICFDLSGFSLRCMDYEVLKMLIDILAFNYPETLDGAYVINAPFIFWACWAVMKPWLDPVTASKVEFVNKDKLSNHFSSDVLAVMNADPKTAAASMNIASSSFVEKDLHAASSLTAATEASESTASLASMDNSPETVPAAVPVEAITS